ARPRPSRPARLPRRAAGARGRAGAASAATAAAAPEDGQGAAERQGLGRAARGRLQGAAGAPDAPSPHGLPMGLRQL
ncbi:MAG: hypothetical protein AVDCRST_MAG08-1456, partial [uncultured Acetobacteraceae bacterium]